MSSIFDSISTSLLKNVWLKILRLLFLDDKDHRSIDLVNILNGLQKKNITFNIDSINNFLEQTSFPFCLRFASCDSLDMQIKTEKAVSFEILISGLTLIFDVRSTEIKNGNFDERMLQQVYSLFVKYLSAHTEDRKKEINQKLFQMLRVMETRVGRKWEDLESFFLPVASSNFDEEGELEKEIQQEKNEKKLSGLSSFVSGIWHNLFSFGSEEKGGEKETRKRDTDENLKKIQMEIKNNNSVVINFLSYLRSKFLIKKRTILETVGVWTPHDFTSFIFDDSRVSLQINNTHIRFENQQKLAPTSTEGIIGIYCVTMLWNKQDKLGGENGDNRYSRNFCYNDEKILMEQKTVNPWQEYNSSDLVIKGFSSYFEKGRGLMWSSDGIINGGEKMNAGSKSPFEIIQQRRDHFWRTNIIHDTSKIGNVFDPEWTLQSMNQKIHHLQIERMSLGQILWIIKPILITAQIKTGQNDADNIDSPYMDVRFKMNHNHFQEKNLTPRKQQDEYIISLPFFDPTEKAQPNAFGDNISFFDILYKHFLIPKGEGGFVLPSAKNVRKTTSDDLKQKVNEVKSILKVEYEDLVPSRHIVVKVSNVDMEVSFDALDFLMQQITAYSAMKTMRVIRGQHRPLLPPLAIRSNVREWWHYCYRLVKSLGNTKAVTNPLALEIQKRIDRKRYISYWKLRRFFLNKSGEIVSNATGKHSSIPSSPRVVSSQEDQEIMIEANVFFDSSLAQIERRYDYSSTALWRLFGDAEYDFEQSRFLESSLRGYPLNTEGLEDEREREKAKQLHQLLTHHHMCYHADVEKRSTYKIPFYFENLYQSFVERSNNESLRESNNKDNLLNKNHQRVNEFSNKESQIGFTNKNELDQFNYSTLPTNSERQEDNDKRKAYEKNTEYQLLFELFIAQNIGLYDIEKLYHGKDISQKFINYCYRDYPCIGEKEKNVFMSHISQTKIFNRTLTVKERQHVWTSVLIDSASFLNAKNIMPEAQFLIKKYSGEKHWTYQIVRNKLMEMHNYFGDAIMLTPECWKILYGLEESDYKEDAMDGSERKKEEEHNATKQKKSNLKPYEMHDLQVSLPRSVERTYGDSMEREVTKEEFMRVIKELPTIFQQLYSVFSSRVDHLYRDFHCAISPYWRKSRLGVFFNQISIGLIVPNEMKGEKVLYKLQINRALFNVRHHYSVMRIFSSFESLEINEDTGKSFEKILSVQKRGNANTENAQLDHHIKLRSLIETKKFIREENATAEMQQHNEGRESLPVTASSVIRPFQEPLDSEKGMHRYMAMSEILHGVIEDNHGLPYEDYAMWLHVQLTYSTPIHFALPFYLTLLNQWSPLIVDGDAIARLSRFSTRFLQELKKECRIRNTAASNCLSPHRHYQNPNTPTIERRGDIFIAENDFYHYHLNGREESDASECSHASGDDERVNEQYQKDRIRRMPIELINPDVAESDAAVNALQERQYPTSDMSGLSHNQMKTKYIGPLQRNSAIVSDISTIKDMPAIDSSSAYEWMQTVKLHSQSPRTTDAFPAISDSPTLSNFVAPHIWHAVSQSNSSDDTNLIADFCSSDEEPMVNEVIQEWIGVSKKQRRTQGHSSVANFDCGRELLSDCKFLFQLQFDQIEVISCSKGKRQSRKFKKKEYRYESHFPAIFFDVLNYYLHLRPIIFSPQINLRMRARLLTELELQQRKGLSKPTNNHPNDNTTLIKLLSFPNNNSRISLNERCLSPLLSSALDERAHSQSVELTLDDVESSMENTYQALFVGVHSIAKGVKKLWNNLYE